MAFRTRIEVKGLGEVEVVEVNKENFEQYTNEFRTFIDAAEADNLPLSSHVQDHYTSLQKVPKNSFLIAMQDGKIIGLRYQRIDGRHSVLQFVIVLTEYQNHKLGSILNYFVLKKLADDDCLFTGRPDYYGGFRSGLYLGGHPSIKKEADTGKDCIMFTHFPGFENKYYLFEDKSIIVKPTFGHTYYLIVRYAPPSEYTIERSRLKSRVEELKAAGKYKKVVGKLSNAEKHFKYVK